MLEDPYLKEVRHAAKTFCGQMKDHKGEIVKGAALVSCTQSIGASCFYGDINECPGIDKTVDLCVAIQALIHMKGKSYE